MRQSRRNLIWLTFRQIFQIALYATIIGALVFFLPEDTPRIVKGWGYHLMAVGGNIRGVFKRFLGFEQYQKTVDDMKRAQGKGRVKSKIFAR